MEAMLALHKTPRSMKCSLCMATTGIVGGFFRTGGGDVEQSIL